MCIKHRLAAWGPPLLVMGIIFVASAQPKHGPPSGASTIYFSAAMPVFPNLWDFVIKKSAHVLIYGLLAVLLLRAMSPYKHALYLAVILTLIYALTDEFHQSFVTGRRSSLIDIGFDLAGTIFFSLIARFTLSGKKSYAANEPPDQCTGRARSAAPPE